MEAKGLTDAGRAVIFNSTKEIIMKALETANHFSTGFTVQNANTLADCFDVLAKRLAQTVNNLL
jgi:hypothetical protein